MSGTHPAYARQHYLDNADAYKARAKVNREQGRRERREFIYQHLLAHPCADCGETDPVVLTFDHLGDKVAIIGRLVRDGASWVKLKAEIAKCEVVCANCHLRRTAQRDGRWHKAQARVLE